MNAAGPERGHSPAPCTTTSNYPAFRTPVYRGKILTKKLQQAARLIVNRSRTARYSGTFMTWHTGSRSNLPREETWCFRRATRHTSPPRTIFCQLPTVFTIFPERVSKTFPTRLIQVAKKRISLWHTSDWLGHCTVTSVKFA